jgi:hypothetical protein
MVSAAIFPTASLRRGMYESFYLRAVSPEEPVAVWIRLTVHKAPGEPPRGSVWCTVFDARRGRPFMHRLSSDELRVPAGQWIAVGDSAAMGPARAEGVCGNARWSLSFAATDSELRHLSPDWLYRAPLPRTKLTSPAPAARFSGVLELDGREAIELREWPGMIGHNWGSEHARRWIWLHGAGFPEAPEAWLDVALGRVLVAGRTTPWLASGAVSIDGRRHRLGGLAARGTRVSESAQGCSLHVAGERGLTAEVDVEVPPQTAAGWRYADPGGGVHEVVHCSIAALRMSVLGAGSTSPLALYSDHGGAYELGMVGDGHDVPIAPFPPG